MYVVVVLTTEPLYLGQCPEKTLHNKNEKNSVDKIKRGKRELRSFFLNLVLLLISSFIFSKIGKQQLQPKGYQYMPPLCK